VLGVARAAGGGEALVANQGNLAPENVGGWNYNGPEGQGDLSTTYYAVGGLVAARQVAAGLPGVDDALDRTPQFLVAAQNADGGFAYRPANESSSSMTAEGLFLYGALQHDDANAAASAVNWLRAHYATDHMIGPFAPTSTFTYFWAAVRGLSLAEAQGDPALLVDPARAPADLGYADAQPGFYFDFAYTLLQWQDQSGAWGNGFGGSPQGWDQTSSHAFALLALERALVGTGPGEDEARAPQCADGVDDDGDGLVDDRDPDCRFACTRSERPQPQCANDLDDDGDGLTDTEDPGCRGASDGDERNPACGNGVDDDGDGRVDFPADPGCASVRGDDEHDPDVPPACANGVDDDGDGATDYPQDVDCAFASLDSEGEPGLGCPAGLAPEALPADATEVRGRTGDGASLLQGSCGGIRGGEKVYTLAVDRPTRLTLSTANDQTGFDTVIYVREACADMARQLGCNDDASAADPLSTLTVNLPSPGLYYVVVDAKIGHGDFVLEVSRTPLPGACANGLDDDVDGLVDMLDPGCADPEDADETDPPAPAACGNGADDDHDGLVDFPLDPGCAGPGDRTETDPAVPADCANGRDDDGDGAVDWPADPSCIGRGAGAEWGSPAPCANHADDDHDGLIDFPFDPGCFAPADRDEADPAMPPACADQVDNDRDGVADFPFDPGCAAASDSDEADPAAPPACLNGRDDDGDGRTDFPLDPGCLHAADESEVDDGQPQCANGADDDDDGRGDFPDDPGCRFAADDDETNPGPLPPRCADGVDNDLDGAIDLQDPGCLDGDDDDETDPDALPECGDGRDDDRDGLVDWPDDPGCKARGDLTESQACRPEIAAPLIPRNGRVMGQTREGDMDAYSARCGGLGAPEAVYRYSLAAPADLRISAANPGTDYPAVVYVRTDCEEPTTALACAGSQAHPEPTVTLTDAQPGEYFIFVDGGGPERFVSSGGQVATPADPHGFQAMHDDFQAGCGWGDGGRDAFDCFGRIRLTFMGNAVDVDPTPGQRQLDVGAYAFRVVSDFAAQNVWRVQLIPQADFDDRRVTLRITGNMGSDGPTQANVQSVEFAGRQIAYEQSSDNFAAPRDPPVLQMLVPSDPDDLGRVQYVMEGDNATTTAADVELPVTFYVAPTYADLRQVATAIVGDLEVQAGPAGPDAPRFGRFELSVTEQ
jgi:hypothetical protein